MNNRWAGETTWKAGPAALSSLVISVLVIAGSVGYAEVYGGFRWLPAAVGGALLGWLVAYLVTLRRWSGPVAVSVSVVVYLLFGAALATPSLATAGWIPNLESLRQLCAGLVTSWRDMLTVAVPIGFTGGLLIPVYLTALAFAGIGTWVAIRASQPVWALLAPAANLAICALLGSGIGRWSLISGLVIGLVGLIWASWRTRFIAGFNGAGLDLRRPISALLVLLAASASAFWVGPLVTDGQPRQAARDSFTVPLDPKTYPSPLAGFRSYVQDLRETPLLTVTGLPVGTPIRLATLDDYDGVVFRVSAATGTFARVGDRLATDSDAPVREVVITVDGYSDVWLPTAGQISGITFAGSNAQQLTESFRYSTGNSTGVVTSGLVSGDSYALSVRAIPQPSAEELATQGPGVAAAGVASRIPDAVKAAALELAAGESTAYGKVEAIRSALVAAGALSHGDTDAGEQVSPSGHGLDRLTRLLAQVPMVGDEEQFAPTMALMAQSIGLPARVVMGFQPGQTYDGTGTLVLTGADVSAWVEVNFAGSGWVAFDPSPDSTEVPPEPDPDPALTPRKQILQPPPPPEVPEEANASDIKDSGEEPKPEDDDDPASENATAANLWFLAWGVGAPLVVIVGPLLLILGLKARRRSARRTAAEPADRVTGAWHEMLDTATDFGRPIPVAATRTEAAALLDAEFGTSAVALANRADAHVFGPIPADTEAATAFWVAANGAMVKMRSSRTPGGRWRAKLSLASLRSKVESPYAGDS